MPIRYIQVDQAEKDYAKQLFDDFVTIWNEREKRGQPGQVGPLPISMCSHHSLRRRIFRDCATGRSYEIMLKRTQMLFQDYPCSWCYEPLRPDNILRVRRIAW